MNICRDCKHSEKPITDLSYCYKNYTQTRELVNVTTGRVIPSKKDYYFCKMVRMDYPNDCPDFENAPIEEPKPVIVKKKKSFFQQVFEYLK